MTAETQQYFSQTRGILALGSGFFVGPFSFLLHLQLNYMLVSWACVTGRSFVLHLVTLGTVLLIAGGGLLAWRSWQETGREWPNDSDGVVPRSRFLAVLGLLLSMLFLFIIIAQWMATLVLSPCQR
jgi:hypothetical protein